MTCNGEQFSDKDSAFIKDALNTVNKPYGESVVIKRFVGYTNPGDPARGIKPILAFTRIPVKAIISNVGQRDITLSGGIYLIGDIRVSLTQKLNAVDNIQQTGGLSQGDRLEYEGHEYRIVGKVDTQTLIGKTRLNTYIFRKIGNA